MMPPSLPDNGMRLLIDGWRGVRGLTVAHRFPPVLLDPGGPEVVTYFDALRHWPERTIVVWSWPGRYRSDVFMTTVGEILLAATP